MTAIIVALVVIFALRAVGVSIVLALFSGLLVGGLLGFEFAQLSFILGDLVYQAPANVTVIAGMILVFIGALLERTGAVLTLPAGRGGAGADLDRSTFISGGAFGLPLPLAAGLVFAAVLTETSLTRALELALWPGIALSAAYLTIFSVAILTRRQAGGGQHQGTSGDIVAVVFRFLVPLFCFAAFVPPVRFGLMTPYEAAAAAAAVALIFIVILVAISQTARAGAGPGLVTGVAGVVFFVMVVAGIDGLSTLAGRAALPQTIAGWMLTLGLSETVLALAIVVVTLAIGTVVGPLGAIGISIAGFYPGLSSAGLQPDTFVVSMFLTAEAVRVGPRLWRGGFLGAPVAETGDASPAHGAPAGWPYYAATLAVLLVFVLAAT